MSMIVITQAPSSRVVINNSRDFNLVKKRAMATRRAVAGNLIRQVSTLHASSAEGVFRGEISKADGDAILAMYSNSATVSLHFQNHVYEAVMEPELLLAPGRRYDATIKFYVVREVQ